MALKETYRDEVIPAMIKAFNYKNKLQAPKVTKVTINMGVGEATQNADALEAAATDLAKNAGQKPVITKAKRTISAFKVRAGMTVGCKVTLRGQRMYDFLEKLFFVVLPQVRDLEECRPTALTDAQLLSGSGAFIFPEIEYDKISKVRGMNITITTTAKTDEGFVLLKALGMLFKR